jgi:hypothetical protein
MNTIRYFGLSTLLLLGGCLEAGDAILGSIEARLKYCHVPPDTVILCPEKEAQRPVLFPGRAQSGTARSAITN